MIFAATPPKLPIVSLLSGHGGVACTDVGSWRKVVGYVLVGCMFRLVKYFTFYILMFHKIFERVLGKLLPWVSQHFSGG